MLHSIASADDSLLIRRTPAPPRSRMRWRQPRPAGTYWRLDRRRWTAAQLERLYNLCQRKGIALVAGGVPRFARRHLPRQRGVSRGPDRRTCLHQIHRPRSGRDERLGYRGSNRPGWLAIRYGTRPRPTLRESERRRPGRPHTCQ